jgi:hypothetical protein
MTTTTEPVPVSEVERVIFGKLFHVSIAFNVVAISPALDDFAHNIAGQYESSLFEELTLADCIDSAEVINGLTVYPCRSENAAVHLARYFASLIDCVAGFTPNV